MTDDREQRVRRTRSARRSVVALGTTGALGAAGLIGLTTTTADSADDSAAQQPQDDGAWMTDQGDGLASGPGDDRPHATTRGS